MMKMMKMNKDKLHYIIYILTIILSVILGFSFGNSELRKNAIIKEQQNLIESYVNILDKEGYFNEHN